MFQIKFQNSKKSNGVLVIDLEGEEFKKIPTSLRKYIQSQIKKGERVVSVPCLDQLSYENLVVYQLPKTKDAFDWRITGGKLARQLLSFKTSIQLCWEAKSSFAGVWLQGLSQGLYQWNQYKTKADKKVYSLIVKNFPKQAQVDLQIAECVFQCRDLVNTPAEDLGPEEFVKKAKVLCKGTTLKLSVLDYTQIKSTGLRCIDAVGRASPRKPKLIVIDYQAKGAKSKPLMSFCGKGVCFDTGGLGIKPSSAMELMRKDMGGAATVLSAMVGLAKTKAKTGHIRAYLPLVDNAIDGSAFRPGDILTAKDGTTIEIGHTDAEGRLILADSICLAKLAGSKNIMTVATLTGAAMVALGRIRVPMMGTSDSLQDKLEVSSEAQGEKVWKLPFDEEYHQLIKGKHADITNSGPSEGSCITAGCFLSHFAGDTNFMHCDISPASWQTKDHDLGDEGATGILVASLIILAKKLS